MNASTTTRTHSLTQGFHFMKHHRWMIIPGIVALLWTIYALDIRIDEQTFSRFREHSKALAESQVPLTRLDDPRYAHEYEARVQYIYDQLDTLHGITGAQRIYIFSYASSGSGNTHISHVFEVVTAGQTPQFSTLQGLPISSVDNMKEALYASRSVYPCNYSTELHDDKAMLIGFFGIEFSHNVALLQEHQLLERMRQTMRDIGAALSQPVEYLDIQARSKNTGVPPLI